MTIRGRVALSLGIACVFAQVGAASIAAAEGRRGSAETAELGALVEGLAHAVEANHLELALAHLHRGSPWGEGVRRKLVDQMAHYQERARTARFEVRRIGGGKAEAAVEQELVRVFGMKLTRSARRSMIEFRREGAAWRIWKITEGARAMAPPERRER